MDNDLDRFINTPQSVWFESNAYSGIPKPYREEKNPIIADGLEVSIEKEGERWVLTVNAPESLISAKAEPITSRGLGMPRISEAPFDNPDGTEIDFTLDIMGARRSGKTIPGPFADLKAGINKIVIW